MPFNCEISTFPHSSRKNLGLANIAAKWHDFCKLNLVIFNCLTGFCVKGNVTCIMYASHVTITVVMASGPEKEHQGANCQNF